MTSAPLLRSDRWTVGHALAAGFLALLGLLATFDAWRDIHLIAAKDPESSHIFLVPLVALWMLWVRRVRLRYCRPAGTALGPVLIALGWAISSYGYRHPFRSFIHGGAVLIVLGCIISVLGKHVIFRFFPVVLVLVFLIPVPGEMRLRIAEPLQRWTAQCAQVLLESVGVPVERSHNLLLINGQSVTIAEACNGLRMVFALILVSYAFSFGLPLRNRVRLLILLASPLAAILCNLVRILPTVWMYGYTSRFNADKFHNYSGWLMLPIAFFVLLGIIRLLRWATIPVMRYTLAG